MIKDQSPSGSDSDENVSLKRAVSEPSPNMSLKSYDSDVFHFVPSMPWIGYRFPSFDGLNRLDSVFDYGLIHPEVYNITLFRFHTEINPIKRLKYK